MGKTDLGRLYASIRDEVEARLEEFRALWAYGSDGELLRELCFCVCTPQTNAKRAWEAVNRLADSGLLESSVHDSAARDALAAVLRGSGVRFHNNKAAYIEANQRLFSPGTRSKIAGILSGGAREARSSLTLRVAGWGLKEASHFLRNIGQGSEICILDRHILRQLVDYGVITAMPGSLSVKVYLETERAMKRFARDEGVPLDALDLTLWFKAKGEVFR
ncbi:MAG: N-glycosylase/DNA lyase [Treponema sp.]|jgi:N-glycosylase/DNA lyase|nr:N-glycosylase/DNA lyase [Treponema sp.]